MPKGIKRNDVIRAVQIAARDAARTSTNPVYVEALELAARALEENTWTMPRRRIGQIRGGFIDNDRVVDEATVVIEEEDPVATGTDKTERG